jgi:regulator of replication initiation timing
MTSVLYSAGLNYQTGNPVRQEIVAVRREVESLRKQLESVTEENVIYRKHLLKLLQGSENGAEEFTSDLMRLSSSQSAALKQPPGGRTVQGAGFSR